MQPRHGMKRTLFSSGGGSGLKGRRDAGTRGEVERMLFRPGDQSFGEKIGRWLTAVWNSSLAVLLGLFGSLYSLVLGGVSFGVFALLARRLSRFFAFLDAFLPSISWGWDSPPSEALEEERCNLGAQ